MNEARLSEYQTRMEQRKTPAYFSLHESTSDLLVSNVSSWKPLWAQGGSSRENKSHHGSRKTKTARHDTANNTRAQTSVYTGILTAQYINSTVYCAIVESKTLSPKVGMCMVDPHRSSMILAEISDSPTFVRTIHKLNVQSDVLSLEILLPISLRRSKTNFVKILECNLPRNATLNYISESAFKSKTSSIEILRKSVKESERNSFQVELRHKRYGLAAACACISYLRTLSDHAFVHETFNVKYESSEESMFISTSAIDDLELIKSYPSKGPNDSLSLFNFLNCTTTKMGERLLKNNILQPLTNKTSLSLRYEAVKELILNDDVTNEVRNETKKLVDLDNLFSYLCKKPKVSVEVISQQKINFILLLKRVLSVTADMRQLLLPFKSELIKEIAKSLELVEIDDSLTLISEYINEDCVWVNKPVDLRNQKCYAVRVGQNGILDASRQLYKTLVNEVLESIHILSQEHNISLESRYDNNRGFFILAKDCRVTLFDGMEDSPFINYVQKGDNVELVTMSILKLNARIDSVLNEIFLMTEDAADELIGKCRKFVSSYFLVSEAFSLLDLMCTFAIVSTRAPYGKYTCPNIDSKNTVLKECRHPLLEHAYTTDSFSSNVVIPNDFTIISSTSRVQIITGPNMSGKSIFLKQFALSVIMSQIGMFVPAEYASMRIYKFLFTRISNDANEPNMSTFSTEMQEMSLILQNANKDSLVIIDELGRGTGYKDGISICISLIERILVLQSTCLFVTHFVGIPKIFQNKPGVFEMHVGVSKDGKDIFKVKPGVNWVSGYGIELAKAVGLFPDDLIEDAEKLSNKLKVSKISVSGSLSNNEKHNTQNKLILNTYEMLQHIMHNVPDDELFETLSALENEFVEKYNPSLEAVTESEKETGGTTTTAKPGKSFPEFLIDFEYLH